MFLLYEAALKRGQTNTLLVCFQSSQIFCFLKTQKNCKPTECSKKSKSIQSKPIHRANKVDQESERDALWRGKKLLSMTALIQHICNTATCAPLVSEANAQGWKPLEPWALKKSNALIKIIIYLKFRSKITFGKSKKYEYQPPSLANSLANDCAANNTQDIQNPHCFHIGVS